MITTTAFFVVLELVLWLFRVAPAHLTEDPYQGFAAHIPHFVSETDEQGRVWMHVSPSKAAVLNSQRFLADKPAGTYRIVCLGGSTTYGRPFFDQTSFPGWLRAFSTVADTSQQWEVINAGAISYASYRVRGIMDELVTYAPDLFVVYTGHNEFLERRTYTNLSTQPSIWTNTISLIYRTRTATVVKELLEAVGARPPKLVRAVPSLGEDVESISIDAVGPEAYSRDRLLADQVVTHFRDSLDHIVEASRKARADILFIKPAANLADFAPFKSEHRPAIADSEVAAWQAHYNRAKSILDKGFPEGALVEIERAENIDDRRADLHYLKGTVLKDLGRTAEAKQAMVRAREEDVCPLRATRPIANSVQQTAAAEDVMFVDFETIVDAASADNIPGREAFHDHVHPTIEMNRQLALEIVEQLRKPGIVRGGAAWNEAAIAKVTNAVMGSIDSQLHAEHLRGTAAVMAILKQPDQARYQAELSLAQSGRTWAALTDLGNRFASRQAGAPGLALEYYREAERLDPRSARLHFAMGKCYLDLEQNQAAASRLRVAEQLHPGNPEYQTYLGIALARQERYQEAIELFRGALEADAGYYRAHYYWAQTLEALADWAEVCRHYEMVLQSVPDHPGAKQRLHLAKAKLSHNR